MKRSEINRIMRRSLAFLESMGFRLPPFAFWTPDEWRERGPECREIVRAQLGWDITDFGGGDFEKLGLFLFTLRNGATEDMTRGEGKPYAEKIMVSLPNQVTPTHFHTVKMEDIINRGGGDFVIRMWNADDGNGLGDRDITVSVDGVELTLPAGEALRLRPGESICLPQRLYHTFWAESEPVMVGEVSLVNDDDTDNHFLEALPRFSEIEEDEAPLHLLVKDYARYYRHC